jgi:hypothetical protein
MYVCMDVTSHCCLDDNFDVLVSFDIIVELCVEYVVYVFVEMLEM